MKITKRLQWNAVCLMSSLVMAFGFASCGTSDDDGIIDADSGKVVEVPEPDTWVTDDDITSDDLDVLMDLTVKVERIRQEFVKMLSNGDEGDKLFCGIGPKTDVGPAIKIFTDMMLRQEEYETVLGGLAESQIMKPTAATRGEELSSILDILFTGRNEAKKEQEKVQDILNKNKVFSNPDAQKQLYDFYCSQEPEYAKEIGAKDSKEFFSKLNNGELNSYMLNISHIWRDKGILMADHDNAVGDYAYTAFTGKAEYVNSAYRVSSKVAVAAGKIYLSAVDRLAGGYGAKIMEWSDAIENKITKLKLMKKTLEGKPDWQGWNTYIVKNLKDDLKTALGEAFGDDDSLGKEVVDQVADVMLEWVVKQCTVEEEEEADADPEKAEQKEEQLKEEEWALINIETDFSSDGKMILVTDQGTGKVHVATPTYDGHVTIATTPGNKMITVIKRNGQRLTKMVTVVAGTNNVIIKGAIEPYIDLNPSSIWLEDEAGSETAVVLTNCKYVKLVKTETSDWYDVQLEINGSAGKGIHVRVIAKANITDKERQGSFTLEGYKEKDSAKPDVTRTFRFRQEAYSPELTPIEVSPESLSFGADGGVKTVKVNTKNYKYMSVSYDKQYDSWLTATPNDDATITVKVARNDTGAERTATLYAYATDVENPESFDEVAFKAITVTQEAGDVAELEFVSIHANVNLDCSGSFYELDQYNNIDETTKKEMSIYIYTPSTVKTIEKKVSGNTLIFEVDREESGEGDDGYGGWEKHKTTTHLTLKVEASNPNDLTTYRIMDMSLTYDFDHEDVGDYWSKDHRIIELVNLNIPIDLNYSTNKIGTFKLKGEDIRPENIKQANTESQSQSYRDGKKIIRKFTYSSYEPNRYSDITVEFTVK